MTFSYPRRSAKVFSGSQTLKTTPPFYGFINASPRDKEPTPPPRKNIGMSKTPRPNCVGPPPWPEHLFFFCNPLPPLNTDQETRGTIARLWFPGAIAPIVAIATITPLWLSPCVWKKEEDRLTATLSSCSDVTVIDLTVTQRSPQPG